MDIFDYYRTHGRMRVDGCFNGHAHLCASSFLTRQYFPDNSRECDCKEGEYRRVAIEDLRGVLAHKQLGAWGMDALISLLNNLIPELASDPIVHD